MKAVLDAGALVAVDKRDRRVGALLRILQQQKIPVWTSATVIAQVWRDGARQAPLARVLAGVGICPFGVGDGKRVGQLQGAAGTEDVVDAHVALMVSSGDHVLTSDPADITHLLAARRVRANVIRV